MPPAKKRKTAASAARKKAADAAAVPAEETPQPTLDPEETVEQTADKEPEKSKTAEESPQEEPAPAAAESSEAAAKAKERMARFKALQARAKTSSDSNLKAATQEAQRLAADPSQLTALHRRHAIASHKLLKAEVEDTGGDFERKRAWDWTVEESERWDKRVKKKEAHRDDVAFQDYRRESQKVYKRQLREMPPDMERYAREKLAAIERAAAQGTLEIVETEDGEMIAVDKEGSFYATGDNTSFAENKPDKAAVDRLVNSVKKADEAAAKKRRERMAKNGDDADVTYINEKNKQFNQKLARFYNKYTAEIRESFERGTMI
ncbi:SYF2 splicing factor [Pleurostoma richardsiae]|uniref:Pre-mRNA-splicing factor SYF2 n=1 Tax=Pleurostoma richardsiae TaxID=41990 RepID=A0AA38VXS4_9PEZI|nr:SYF2 splicing factor [Pleurostoma richardsiae]